MEGLKCSGKEQGWEGWALQCPFLCRRCGLLSAAQTMVPSILLLHPEDAYTAQVTRFGLGAVCVCPTASCTKRQSSWEISHLWVFPR